MADESPTDAEILVRVLRQIDAFEEESGRTVLCGEDRALLELANSPCSRCDPSFGCWAGKELCRKKPLARKKHYG